MFSLSARFRKSRREGRAGTVYYQIHSGKSLRCITGTVKGEDEGVMNDARDKIASDLMTIYCIIESRYKNGEDMSIDTIAEASAKALAGENPYVGQLKGMSGKYMIHKEVATVCKVFSDKFEVLKSVGAIKPNPATLSEYFAKLIIDYETLGKPYVKSLRNTQNSIARYLNGADLPLSGLTTDFILDYRKYLAGQLSPGTVAFYLRVLHTVITRGEKEGLIPAGFKWPISAKIVLRAKEDNSNALDITTIRNMEQLDLSHDRTLELTRDMFMFGFYAQGMELDEIMNLKSGNITGNILTYRRRQIGKIRNIPLGAKALSIVQKYKAPDSEFVFPFLTLGKWTYSDSTFKLKVSKAIESIGRLLKSPVKLTFNMNIYSWKSIVGNANIAELLISH